MYAYCISIYIYMYVNMSTPLYRLYICVYTYREIYIELRRIHIYIYIYSSHIYIYICTFMRSMHDRPYPGPGLRGVRLPRLGHPARRHARLSAGSASQTWALVNAPCILSDVLHLQDKLNKDMYLYMYVCRYVYRCKCTCIYIYTHTCMCKTIYIMLGNDSCGGAPRPPN